MKKSTLKKENNPLSINRKLQGPRKITFILFFLVWGGTIMGCSSNLKRSGKFIEIGEHSMWISISGKGSPAVILESGIGDQGSFGNWKAVQKSISKLTQVIIYDRAGLGKSEPGPLPRDTEKIVEELHTLLQKSEIKPPYILVGHSMGGLHVQVFAEIWSEEVVGMVLVDPSPKELLEPLGPEKISDLMAIGLPPGSIAELDEGLSSSLDRFRAAKPLAYIPLIVISSSYHEDPSGQVTYERYQELLDYHQKLADSVDNGKHIIASDSGHYIQIDEPELVIEAIKELLVLLPVY